MKDNQNFETYLFLSPKKFIISVNQKKDFKRIYYKEILNNKSTDEIDLDLINYFLENNIFEIEKKIRKFIKNIYLIIDSKKFLTLQLSIKKNNYGNSISKNNLVHLLSEAKEECKKTINNRKIVHMIIDNYVVNGRKYSSLENNQNIKQFCLEVNFISISNDLVFIFEKLMEKYQIKVSQYMCGNYIKNYLDEDNNELSLIVYKLNNGMNNNEVILIPKNIENSGFF